MNSDIRYLIKGQVRKPPSSRGLGHLPFTEATGIRIPLGVYVKLLNISSFIVFKKDLALKLA